MADANAEQFVIMETEKGQIVMKMNPAVAPNHVAAFTKLAAEDFYRDIPFHRVIPGFVAQAGDPSLVGRPKVDFTLDAEFSNIPHVAGTLAAARTSDPNSASSQFYIVLDDAPHLNGQYTVFGEVVEGMDNVYAIGQGDTIVSTKLVDNWTK